MADPLSIYGAIETSFSFAKMIWDFANDIKDFREDHADVVIRFGFEKAVLEKFMSFFKEHEKKIDEVLRAEIAGLTKSLKDKLKGLSSDIEKRKKGNWWDHLVWPLVKKDIMDAETELGMWVGLMNVPMSHLPEFLRVLLSEKFVSQDYWGHKKTLSSVVASTRMRSKETQLDTEEQKQALLKLRDLTLEDNSSGQFYTPDRIIVPDEFLFLEENHKIEFEVGKLVNVLSDVDAQEMHIPKARGYFATKGEATRKGLRTEYVGSYSIVYEKPSYIKSTANLKELLREKNSISLTQRIRIALELTAAVAYVHAVGWVHELIRPENVLLCFDRDSNRNEGDLGHVNLFGFGKSRRSSGEVVSLASSDTGDWTTEIYCHPDRQQRTLQDHAIRKTEGVRYAFKHDVYSLGVVLLEIGMWQDLEAVMRKGAPDQATLMNAMPEDRRTALKALAKSLPRKTGDVYANVVLDCLKVNSTKINVKQVLEQLESLRI